jgi:hypothetical protein
MKLTDLKHKHLRRRLLERLARKLGASRTQACNIARWMP